MTELKGKIAIITGATAGIGRETAKLFAKEGCNLILTGRRENRLLELKEELEHGHGVSVSIHAFDISSRFACEEFVSSIPEEFREIGILVNNAGVGRGMDKLHEGSMDDWEEMIDTNVKGLLYITRLIAPGMVKRNIGHIINVGSIAGQEVYPGGNIYCASKYAVHAISQALRMELVDTSLRVTEIAPGMVETEFSVVRFHGDKERANNVYKGLDPLTGADIADLIIFAASRPAHVQINEVIVMPTAQATATIAHRKG
ncbi:MAG: NAD(P)-dependent oxidoreductase [Acidobacteria bacterium CG_4_9_14_3_um_filter_49_7]|nr:MAG: NAD(P)-dependent oxidoreductase [Acidobacteria bacterium CG_4_9_14_3_um_filter_49_7]